MSLYRKRLFSLPTFTLKSGPHPVSRRFSSISAQRAAVGYAKGLLDHKNRYSLVHEQLSGLPAQLKDQQPFLVLGIETSCDDTAVGIVSSTGQILANVVYSQHGVHGNFGGIVPGLAMKEHSEKIDEVVAEALKKAGLTKGIEEVDAIAVTKGPGLEICLRVGLRKAQVDMSAFLYVSLFCVSFLSLLLFDFVAVFVFILVCCFSN
jgi:hypothetical protein